jgi:hypothetical protein
MNIDRERIYKIDWEDKPYYLKSGEIEKFIELVKDADDAMKEVNFWYGRTNYTEERMQFMRAYFRRIRKALAHLRDCDLRNRRRKSWYDYC